MTDADGMDHPYDLGATATSSGWGRRDYYGADRRRPVPTRTQLEAEAGRHKEKLRRVEAKLAALENIPEQDPYPNGAVLYFRRGQYTFVALRVNSFWYTTGRKEGVSRVPWVQFVDWMLEGRVDVIHEMTMGQAIRFGAAAALPVQRCERHGGPHKPHRVSDSMTWCDGSEGFGGTLTLAEQTKRTGSNEAINAADVTNLSRASCMVGNNHKSHVWYMADSTSEEQLPVLCPGVGPGVAAPVEQKPDHQPVTTEEGRIADLTNRVALWRSVATQSLGGPVSESGIHVTCGLAEKHGAHLWASLSGSLVTCEGRLADAPGKCD